MKSKGSEDQIKLSHERIQKSRSELLSLIFIKSLRVRFFMCFNIRSKIQKHFSLCSFGHSVWFLIKNWGPYRAICNLKLIYKECGTSTVHALILINILSSFRRTFLGKIQEQVRVRLLLFLSFMITSHLFHNYFCDFQGRHFSQIDNIIFCDL